MLTKTSAFVVIVRIPLCLLILSLVCVGIFAKRGLVDLRRMEREATQMENRVAQVRKDRERIQRKLEAFHNSREEQERVVREALGYVKPQELVIEF